VARKKYKITESDRWYACRWLEKKLQSPTWLGETNNFQANSQYAALDPDDLSSLNKWGEQWLSSSDWVQMKNAIRASRRRSKEEPGGKSVTLSRKSWMILNYLAGKDGCTLSQVVERRLGMVDLNIKRFIKTDLHEPVREHLL